jgi:hypothetical protein
MFDLASRAGRAHTRDMTSARVPAVRQWIVLAVVLAAAVFLFWPRPAADCTLYGTTDAVSQAMPSAMANAGAICLR